jgi:hypothetical protein
VVSHANLREVVMGLEGVMAFVLLALPCANAYAVDDVFNC